jgi:hypothetical protein
MLHSQVSLDKNHAVLEILVDISIFVVFVIQFPHHVVLKMLEQKHLVVEFSWVIVDGVICAMSMYSIAFARCVDVIKVPACQRELTWRLRLTGNSLLTRRQHDITGIVEVHTDRPICHGKTHPVLSAVIQPTVDKQLGRSCIVFGT